MKCREFEYHIDDFAAGRLPDARAADMEAHRSACSSCARAMETERIFRARWLELPPVREADNLWPRLAARLEKQAAPRPIFSRRFALGGALAVTAALVVMFARQTLLPTPTPSDSPVNERKVVQMVAQMNQISDPGNDIVLAGIHDYQHNTRVLLIGSEDK